MDDRDIDLSDCPEVTAQMCDRAVVRRSAKEKAEVILTIDAITSIYDNVSSCIILD